MHPGTSRYSAQAPLMVLPNRQPPSGPPHCEWAAVQAVETLAARRDRADDDALPDLVLVSSPSPSSSMTPTGSCPRISPGLTGYSPRTMCTSVPQMVVAVIRMTASPALARASGPPPAAHHRFPETRPLASCP